jgi:hypothetical protein
MRQVWQEGQPTGWLGPTTSRQWVQERAIEGQDHSQTQHYNEIEKDVLRQHHHPPL